MTEARTTEYDSSSSIDQSLQPFDHHSWKTSCYVVLFTLDAYYSPSKPSVLMYSQVLTHVSRYEADLLKMSRSVMAAEVLRG